MLPASPPSADREQVTALLIRWTEGDDAALNALMPIVYAELRKTADGLVRGDRDRTLQPTALVHEAWMRLVRQDHLTFEHRKQFYGLVAQVMRRILVDHARAASADKRGGGAQLLSLDTSMDVGTTGPTVDLLALDDALARLSKLDARQAQVIEMRYFGGLTTDETAETLGISPSTVARAQRAAEAWLSAAMSDR